MEKIPISQSRGAIRPAGSAYAFAFVALVLLISASCGGPPKALDTASSGGAVSLEFADYDAIALQGIRFQPEAISQQPMLRVTPDKKTSIAKLRKKVKRKHSQVEAQVLASMLWAQDETPESATRSEALQLLRAEAQTRKSVDPVTLQMLAAAESWAKNNEAWIEANQRLASMASLKGKNSEAKAWLSFALLTANRNQEALAAVEGLKLEDSDYFEAYAIAWANFRNGNTEAAARAIAEAAKAWPGPLRGAIKRDVLLFFSRGGVTVDFAKEQFSAFKDSDPAEWMNELSRGFMLAGHYDKAIRALEVSLELQGNPPVREQVGALFMQAEYWFRENVPARAAETVRGAHKLLAECADCGEKLREQITERVDRLASFFHSVYQATRDEQFYEPAVDLYSYLLNSKVDAEKQQTRLDNLQVSKRDGKDKDGLQPEDTMYQLVLARREVAQACYERFLQGSPVLSGSVALTLDVNPSGDSKAAAVVVEKAEADVKAEANMGAEADAKAETDAEAKAKLDAGAKGAADPAALGNVAKCLQSRAGDWTFPGRSRAGMTKVSVTYKFSPRGTK